MHLIATKVPFCKHFALRTFEKVPSPNFDTTLYFFMVKPRTIAWFLYYLLLRSASVASFRLFLTVELLRGQEDCELFVSLSRAEDFSLAISLFAAVKVACPLLFVQGGWLSRSISNSTEE